MGRPPARPAGADDFLKWRRSIDEHLELGRLGWDEYGMFSWLCTKADPRTGTLRTSWPSLSDQTRLTANHVGKLCRSLKRKGYVSFQEHRGRRFGLIEIGIDKFPLRDGSYTALRGRGGIERQTEREADRVAEGLAERKAEGPAEVQPQARAASAASERLRVEKRRKRVEESALRVREADHMDHEEHDLRTGHGQAALAPTDTVGNEAGAESDAGGAESREVADPSPVSMTTGAATAPVVRDQAETAPGLSREQALAAAPRALRETVELFWLKTSRDTLTDDDLAALDELDRAHTPAMIQKAITESVARFRRRGGNPRDVTFRYVWESLQHFVTRKAKGAVSLEAERPTYPPGLTRLH